MTLCALMSLMLCHLSHFARSHSWLECTDYRFENGSVDGEVWNANKCHGHPRCGQRQASAGFGIDTGFNYRSSTGCQCQKAADNYNGIEMAVYKPGQLVCLAYPPKNHVAATCTTPYVPDTGVVITRHPLYDDTSVSTTYDNLNGVHKNGKVDYSGFQHCPRFCDDMEKALCTMCFQLEKDIAPGTYSFHWIWSFNSKEDSFTTCWEAQVTDLAGKVPNPPSGSSPNTSSPSVPSISPIPPPSSISLPPTPAPTNPSRSPTPVSSPPPPPPFVPTPLVAPAPAPQAQNSFNQGPYTSPSGSKDLPGTAHGYSLVRGDPFQG
uniref:Predicted protein putative n=1 Tax=Albugo laibachii Nc14 TaxID=890382 RepID=F0WQ07_9STRA|nr:predicted protein putative [Albugo laibachii Nc14]|eukprot:CCA23412.1 predicted protein putative [Albugo laibachii Nc14]